ncbi:MAG: hypothetical protein CMB78_02545 [Euryarchaeota archaeon]|nr:hypothetical protein [Euryarchaeota archaeon]
MLIFSPITHSTAEQLHDSKQFVNSEVSHTYSRAVQIALERVSDIDSYDQAQLLITESWLVVTGIAIEDHPRTMASPDSSTPSPSLVGAYIWNFNNPKSALDRLTDSLESGQIESFSPLVKQEFSPRLIPNDPNFEDQWHLQNSGQSSGTIGEDANITEVWDSYNGTGVTISIIDDGVDHAHADLASNYVSSLSYDWCGSDTDPSPSVNDEHGTAVAGVAAAVGQNNIDVIGAAFGAAFAAHRLISCGFSDSTAASTLSFQNNQIDIYSNSWGPDDDGVSLDPIGPLTIAAFENDVYSGRDGLGNIITWAAGNGLGSDDNSNYDGYANSRFTIAVTAVSHTGVQSPYAEPGANILVAAHSSGSGVGITTTDNTGSGGYNTSGNITHTFGGTSSATPLASGVIALMIEANRNLTWRDVQNILVLSSKKNDENDSSWNENGAGHLVSHKYGFGTVDAGAAVSMAENWSSSGQEVNASFGPFSNSTPIPNGGSSWTEFEISVPVDLQLESIDVTVDISHTARGDLDIVLESPSGHQSWLAEERNDNNNDYSNWTFGTVQHWGESSSGNWTLMVRDSVSDSNSGTFNSWEISFHGVGNVSDSDGDGWPDYNDDDDDNDGWSDDIEENCGSDPLDNSSTPGDLDSDGICDYVDDDDDGDGFGDSLEESCDSDPLDNSSTPGDLDSDGICDYVDDDDDGDGLSDANETVFHKTDPRDNDTDDDGLSDYEEIMTYSSNPLNPDSDGDGLGDYNEVFIYGSSPNSQDSDGDGISDYDEVKIWSSDPIVFDPDNDSDSYYHFEDCDDDDPGVNPSIQELLNGKDDDCDGFIDEGFDEIDQDSDGLSDWEEYNLYGTSINSPDSDSDGLSDYQEIVEFGSDPLFVDIDNDGDGVYWFDDCDDNDVNLSPLLAEELDTLDNDCDGMVDEDFFWVDSDMDGITDYAEYYDYSTDPNNGDSDGDGLPDGIEVNEHKSDPLSPDPDSDLDGWYHFQDCDDGDFERSPERPEELDGKDNDCDELIDEDFYDLDSDGDGLSDFSEFHNYSTSPDSVDSDQDGMDDWAEIVGGETSPLVYDYDSDMDGFYEFQDCNDLVGSIFPGATEQWNQVDDNCDGLVDESIDRLAELGSNKEKTRGVVFSEDGSILDGPRFFDTQPNFWDSANSSITISLTGIQMSDGVHLSWSISGLSLASKTSENGRSVTIPTIDCKNPLDDIQRQICGEGDSMQKVKAVISEEGFVTEIEWTVQVSIWVEPEEESGLIPNISEATLFIGALVFLVGISGGGVLVGLRYAKSRKLQDALEAYGVTPERLSIRPERRGLELPSAPDFSWSEEQKK